VADSNYISFKVRNVGHTSGYIVLRLGNLGFLAMLSNKIIPSEPALHIIGNQIVSCI
jgi:hypothetical protein